MSNMLEAWVLLYTHHNFRLRRASLIYFISALIFVVVVSTVLIREICWPFVLMSAAIVLKPAYSFIYIARRVLVQLLIVAKDDDSYIDGAQHGKLVRLLEETAFSLEEGDRSEFALVLVNAQGMRLSTYLFRSSRIGLICAAH